MPVSVSIVGRRPSALPPREHGPERNSCMLFPFLARDGCRLGTPSPVPHPTNLLSQAPGRRGCGAQATAEGQCSGSGSRTVLSLCCSLPTKEIRKHSSAVTGNWGDLCRPLRSSRTNSKRIPRNPPLATTIAMALLARDAYAPRLSVANQPEYRTRTDLRSQELVLVQ